MTGSIRVYFLGGIYILLCIKNRQNLTDINGPNEDKLKNARIKHF